MGIDAERQVRAKEYAHIRHRLFALDLLLSLVALLIVLFSGLAVWWRDIVGFVTTNAWVATALFFIVAFGVYGVLNLPITYYSSFVLQHRYGLSTQTLRAWLTDMLKGAVLASIFGIIIVEIVYFLLRTAPDEWWLIASAFMLLFNIMLANLAPVLIFPIFFKFKPLQDPELVARLTALAERAQAHVRGVYTMMLSEKTTAANAALMGLGNTRRIVLGDTLYEEYSHDEIETILAHELGHHVHRDIAWLLAVETALTLVGFFIADVFLKWSVARLGFASIADLATFPLFALALGAFGLVTMPLGNAFSRWREGLADEYALQTTRKAGAFIGAMEKLANQNLAELEPEPWVEFLLYDHPPIGKRLKRGEQFATSR